jgi:hypothetical protein
MRQANPQIEKFAVEWMSPDVSLVLNAKPRALDAQQSSGWAETFSSDAGNVQITRYSLRGTAARSFGHAVRLEALIPLSVWHAAKMRGFGT